IGIYRADQLQIVQALGGEEIPAERDNQQNSEQDKDPVACIHKHFLQTRAFLTLGMGISARTRLARFAPLARSTKSALPRNCTAALRRHSIAVFSSGSKDSVS